MIKNSFHYGGQAVIEGVMIRGQKAVVIAARRPNDQIVICSKPLSSLYTGWVRKTPLLRGIIVLLESMVLGIQSLLYSASIALEEETEKIPSGYTLLMIILSLGFATLLFFITPLFLTGLFDPYIESSLVFHLVEGFIRLVIFIVYIKIITNLSDMKRVFAYHGAEHATINAYEAHISLQPELVKDFSTAHTRCGTSFLLAVLVIAIIVFSLFGRQDIWLMVLSRIFLLPVIAALSYELIQYTARHSDNPLVKLIMVPGLWLQSLTTKQPDEKQIEVAISSLKKAIEVDQGYKEVA